MTQEILNKLEEELNKLKSRVNFVPTSKLDQSIIFKKQEEYFNFIQSFYYKPAEIAIEKNKLGIQSVQEKDFASSENYFTDAITHFNHPLFYVNLAMCYKFQNKELTLPSEIDNNNIAWLINMAFNNNVFLKPCYINIDNHEDNYGSSPLQGYNYVYEVTNLNLNKQTLALILNVPYIVWKEFYTNFLSTYLNTPQIYKISKLIDDSEMFLYEVRNCNNDLSVHPQEEIPVFPLINIEIPLTEKRQFLNSYKNFILEFYLKNYDQTYFEPDGSPEYWYFQAERENEKVYGMLKSAIYNIKNNIDNPFLVINQREYLKGILEYRSFFPNAFPTEINLPEYISHTLEEHILETISNQEFKENLSILLHSALNSIKTDPNSIPTYLRKSIETTFKYIVFKVEHKVKKKFNLSEAMDKYTKPFPIQENLSEFFLDIMSIENLQIVNRQTLTKTSYDKALTEINRTANQKIHFDWKQKAISMKAITQKEALDLFLKTTYSLEVLIKEYKL